MDIRRSHQRDHIGLSQALHARSDAAQRLGVLSFGVKQLPADVTGRFRHSWRCRDSVVKSGVLHGHPLSHRQGQDELLVLDVLLSIGDTPFTLLGTGGGLIEAPVTVTELLPPACRAELAVGPYAAGDRFHIDALPYSRGMVKKTGGRLATVEVSTGQPTRPESRPPSGVSPPSSTDTPNPTAPSIEALG